jgi:NitT/TauT family transport system ATP-binding protein
MADIRFEAVQRAFVQGGKEFLAVGGIDLVVANQEFVAIVGPSGCGKTTCMRMVAGLDQPTSGRVLVNGKEVTEPGPERAVVFQQFALFPWKTVFENIAFGLRAMGLGQSEIGDRVNRFISMMGLSGYEQAYPHQLSGGMQQRVAIARADGRALRGAGCADQGGHARRACAARQKEPKDGIVHHPCGGGGGLPRRSGGGDVAATRFDS